MIGLICLISWITAHILLRQRLLRILADQTLIEAIADALIELQTRLRLILATNVEARGWRSELATPAEELLPAIAPTRWHALLGRQQLMLHRLAAQRFALHRVAGPTTAAAR